MHVVIVDTCTVPPPSQSVRMGKGTLSTSPSVKDGSHSRLSLLTRYGAVLEGMSTGFQSVLCLGPGSILLCASRDGKSGVMGLSGV